MAAPPHAKSLAKLRRALKDRNAARARGEDPFNSERPADVGDVALQLMASATIPPAFSPNKVLSKYPNPNPNPNPNPSPHPNPRPL